MSEALENLVLAAKASIAEFRQKLAADPINTLLSDHDTAIQAAAVLSALERAAGKTGATGASVRAELLRTAINLDLQSSSSTATFAQRARVQAAAWILNAR